MTVVRTFALPTLVLGLAIAPVARGRPAPGGTPGTWQLTASMSTARALPCGALLLDGRVLVAGGRDTNGDALASAEIYDPLTDTWSAAADMAVARCELPTATTLVDGRVLVAGGTDSARIALASAELYDPVSDTWAPAGAMPTARHAHGAVRLPSGEVLVVGGWPDVTKYGLREAELYDPLTGSWSVTGGLAVARRVQVVLLANGGVLAAGGTDCCPYTAQTASESYDRASGAWTATADLGAGRGGVSPVLLPTGEVLASGGGEGVCCPWTAILDSAELFDPGTGTWTPTGAMNAPRKSHSSVPLADGTVLIVGGADLSGTLATCELYDPSSGTFGPTGSMNHARQELVLLALPSGQVFATGGSSETGPSASAELYTPPDLSVGDNYCGPAAKNSTGLSGVISALGSDVAAINALTLTAGQLPTHEFGYFLTSETKSFVPFAGGSQGHLCLGGSIGRYNRNGEVLDSGGGGSFSLALDLTDTPQPNGSVAIAAGETWNFQAWFRDVNPVPTSNFTDGLSVTFK